MKIVLSVLLTGACLISLPAAAQQCEVKIGIIGPMTGGGAIWGLAEKAGTEFEVAWTNANGGLQVGSRKCKVLTVSFDALATAAGGAAASNYLASQNVHAVIGPIAGPENTGFKTVARRYAQVNFTGTSALDAIDPKFPLIFHQLQSPPAWGPIVIKAAKARFNFRSAVVVGPNDQGGTDPGNALAKIYNANGVKTTTEWYQRGTTNFAPIAARLIRMNTDAVEFGPMPPGDAGVLAKQLLQAGYTGVLAKLGSGGDVILQNAGGVRAQKAFYWFDYVPTEDPGFKKMNADFQRLMKNSIPENALVYTAQISTEQLLRAISLAGSDQDGVRIAAELRTMTPYSRYLGKGGWRGKSQFGINQELSFPVGLNFISNGKKEPQKRLEIRIEN